MNVITDESNAESEPVLAGPLSAVTVGIAPAGPAQRRKPILLAPGIRPGGLCRSILTRMIEDVPLRITEIFYSLQGEGFHAGTPAVFVRGAGCNLACTFCDTDFSLKARLAADAVAERVAEYPARFVVLTGGEPTAQAPGFRRLVELLHARGCFVTLETNGTSEDTLGVDWVTVSPKPGQGGEWKLRRGHELKLLYEGQDLEYFERSEFSHYFLQPKEIRTGTFGSGVRDAEATRREWERTVSAALAHPRWRLSFQLHKELGLR